MAQKIFEVEYDPEEGVTMRFKAPDLLLASKVTKARYRTARKEMLLALRSLLDKAIEGTEKTEKRKTGKKTKVEVQ